MGFVAELDPEDTKSVLSPRKNPGISFATFQLPRTLSIRVLPELDQRRRIADPKIRNPWELEPKVSSREDPGAKGPTYSK